MKGMGFRTIKTAIGAGLAIWISTLLDLEFATFSAIIVIMCIEKTKKRTIVTMKDKFLASLLSLLFGTLFFEGFGYVPFVFSAFIIVFIPFLIKLRIQSGFVTSMVVVLHIYAVRDATLSLLLNELTIIVIGMGIALLVNSFMPSFKQDIYSLKKEIEQQFETILYEFAAYLRDPSRNWDGKELLSAEELIQEAKSIAVLDVENHYLRKENLEYYYLDMREQQLELLMHLVKVVSIVSSTSIPLQQKEMLAVFLENLSKNVHAGDTTDQSLQELAQLKNDMRQTELPKDREEFEIRANLFYLIFEMENYLTIKKKLFEKRNKMS